ncbi:MAG TPA: hypothetical protein VFF67_10195 [Thermoplasmata archaeon]|nr:hypothetical protein [Thermoplasmata archaeon]
MPKFSKNGVSSIRVTVGLRLRLAALKQIPRESYEAVLNRLLDEHERRRLPLVPPAEVPA